MQLTQPIFWKHNGTSTNNYNYSSTGDVVNQNPLFVSYDADIYNRTVEYQLQSLSPARDAGTTIASFDDDYDGNARPRGNGFDIGAYEYKLNISPPSGLRIIN
jgi:hypothetical protein